MRPYMCLGIPLICQKLDGQRPLPRHLVTFDPPEKLSGLSCEHRSDDELYLASLLKVRTTIARESSHRVANPTVLQFGPTTAAGTPTTFFWFHIISGLVDTLFHFLKIFTRSRDARSLLDCRCARCTWRWARRTGRRLQRLLDTRSSLSLKLLTKRLNSASEFRNNVLIEKPSKHYGVQLCITIFIVIVKNCTRQHIFPKVFLFLFLIFLVNDDLIMMLPIVDSIDHKIQRL